MVKCRKTIILLLLIVGLLSESVCFAWQSPWSEWSESNIQNVYYRTQYLNNPSFRSQYYGWIVETKYILNDYFGITVESTLTNGRETYTDRPMIGQSSGEPYVDHHTFETTIRPEDLQVSYKVIRRTK
jgi:hypothetical protein